MSACLNQSYQFLMFYFQIPKQPLWVNHFFAGCWKLFDLVWKCFNLSSTLFVCLKRPEMGNARLFGSKALWGLRGKTWEENNLQPRWRHASAAGAAEVRLAAALLCKVTFVPKVNVESRILIHSWWKQASCSCSRETEEEFWKALSHNQQDSHTEARWWQHHDHLLSDLTLKLCIGQRGARKSLRWFPTCLCLTCRLPDRFHGSPPTCRHRRHDHVKVQLPDGRHPERDCVVPGEHSTETDCNVLAWTFASVTFLPPNFTLIVLSFHK